MLKKYIVIFCLALTSFAYLVLMDVITGIGWQSSFINAPFHLFALSEKILAFILLGFLILPDVFKVYRSHHNKAHPPSDSSS